MNRKKVLLWSMSPEDGTSFYRGWGVWSKIPGVDLIPFYGQEKWSDFVGIDAAVIQRPSEQVAVRTIERLKSNKIPVIVDYDDDVFNVPSQNQVAEHYHKDVVKACLKACFNLADVVTVSTEALKESILVECPQANIVVIPNAVDDKRFKFKKNHKRDKTILLRGAGSHGLDWGLYADKLCQLMERNPEWTLAVMGFTPTWLNQIKNLHVYEFSDIPDYFEKLENLNPSLMIVPLEDTLFNRAKSNIAQLEGLIAGAPCAATDLPEFDCSETFTPETFVEVCEELMNDEMRTEMVYQTQLKFAPLLSQVNEKRRDILETIQSKRLFRPVATDQEFHEYAISHGLSNDFPQYAALMDKATDWVVKTFNPKQTFELGCGNCGLLHKFLQKGIMAQGVEINPIELAYFTDRYPMFANQVWVGDITTEEIHFQEPIDLILSTEVFEHIDKPDEWFVVFLENLSWNARHFYFTSTPYRTIADFDKFWSHVNLKLPSQWIKIFQDAGWEIVGSPRVMTSWDLQFKSTRF